METTNDIRRGFLDYFAGHGHRVVDSGPLVPDNDPTLLFTNSGMVQFKNVFTGAETLDFSRAASSQKCVRAGGKHNDLENVGYTARHHTFFEMLGNFSFGDYFKDEAIELAWNLVRGEFGVAADRLLVTVFADDDIAFDLWKKISGLPEGRILRIATSDNFWSMGETGPCGPCSEIFYDHGEHIPGGPPGSADEAGDRFIEIWNLVFMQFDQTGPDQRNDLPNPSIDTGMGLERMAALMQGTNDNYQTDLFRALIAASAEASATEAGGKFNVSHRVIADHLRAGCFLITGGVLPSSEGRGYVLRRILRRAMRHAHLMGCAEPLLWRLVPALIGEMGQAFPELIRAQALITETLEIEETRFKRTLERGLGLLDEALADLPEGAELPGEVAFKLYDTYGFPLDLTQDALRVQGIGVDLDGFDAAMERQRRDAREAWAGSGDAATEEVWFQVRAKAGATEFVGYGATAAEGVVVALIAEGAEVAEAVAGNDIAVVTNQTPFYGESGGQEGDRGVLGGAAGLTVAVTDTQKKLGDLHVHLGRVEAGKIAVGDEIRLTVDGRRRSGLAGHHSATHLLHAALRRRLGDHVAQKGSLVAGDRLRFDINHPRPLTAGEIGQIEDDVNEQIVANARVATRAMTPDQAVEAGALALFGEKYGDEVRVVSMGVAAAGDSAAAGGGSGVYSTELCGGTHVRRTGDIGLFKIVGESAVAAGVRRIEAVAGEAARAHFAQAENTLAEAAALLRAPPGEVANRIAALLDERKKLESELVELRRRMATGGGAGAEVKEIAGVKFAGRALDGVPAKDLKGLVDDLKAQLGSGVVALVSVTEGKASLVVGVTDDLTSAIDAVDLVRAGAGVLGGKGGGGRPDMAQAGGPDGAKAADALSAIEAALALTG